MSGKPSVFFQIVCVLISGCVFETIPMEAYFEEHFFETCHPDGVYEMGKGHSSVGEHMDSSINLLHPPFQHPYISNMNNLALINI